MLIGFNAGICQAIDLSAWIAGNPVDVLATNFNKPASLFERFPRKDVFIAPNQQRIEPRGATRGGRTS
jgi:oxalate decarboxylase